MRILLASSNSGKLREYRELAGGTALEIVPLPNFETVPQFEESAPTFAENAAGKALHYSRNAQELVLAEDSGLVVPALDGAPGVRSARYAGPNATPADCVAKLLREMEGKQGTNRAARFVCVIAVARQGRTLVVASDFAEGTLATEPRGKNGFGYDPIFCFTGSSRSCAEVSSAEKNLQSHRGRAFRRVADLVSGNFANLC